MLLCWVWPKPTKLIMNKWKADLLYVIQTCYCVVPVIIVRSYKDWFHYVDGHTMVSTLLSCNARGCTPLCLYIFLDVIWCTMWHLCHTVLHHILDRLMSMMSYVRWWNYNGLDWATWQNFHRRSEPKLMKDRSFRVSHTRMALKAQEKGHVHSMLSERSIE